MAAVSTPATVRLADYRPPDHRITEVDLGFVLDETATEVTARLVIESTYDRTTGARPLVLDGDALELLGITLDGVRLGEDAWRIEDGKLVLPEVPERFELGLVTRIDPKHNTALSGLYLSNGVYCTQCEAEGFRRITFYQDRPDVLARWRVRIEADKARCPVLLANGNLVEEGELDGGRHFAIWEDPFPKPAYLFALVAGDLGRLDDRFVTASGRDVELRIYSEHENIDQCRHAMDVLKSSMRWDEEVYGLEYDLDLFMIVAVGDFNMGAMENKGLNVFNTALVLADPETATDADYMNIERVVAHEYFHNWTGNRITLRDWFQLSLKEGLTVFRDQHYMEDRFSAAVQRISEAQLLREAQFVEDSGPLAHPVRPDSYVEINNFYTRTVYDKGAEVVRMLRTLIGPEAFRTGIDLYVARHDGQAVTCEDFVAAMAEASGRDLSRFFRWYEQAGTPRLTVAAHHDPDARTFTLEITQDCPPTPGQPTKQPFHIPLAMGLIGEDGAGLPLRLRGENVDAGSSRVLELTERKHVFTFENIARPPVPSLLRGFSAPVQVEAELDDAQLGLLYAHDPDPFARFEAGQTLAVRILLRLIEDRRAGRPLVAVPMLEDAFAAILDDDSLDPAFKAMALGLPSASYVGQHMATIDVDGIFEVRRFLRRSLGARLGASWQRIHESGRDLGSYAPSAEQIGRRRLKNLALAYLVASGEAGEVGRARAQFDSATNMTDRLVALALLAEDGEGPDREAPLAAFHARFRHHALALDKWFRVQAMAERTDAIETVERLFGHPDFTMRNPNRVRALIGAFAQGNPSGFHRADGAGYRLVADRILDIDRANPQLAARLLTCFGRWRRYDEARRRLMQAELLRIRDADGLSRDSWEIASKSLA